MSPPHPHLSVWATVAQILQKKRAGAQPKRWHAVWAARDKRQGRLPMYWQRTLRTIHMVDVEMKMAVRLLQFKYRFWPGLDRWHGAIS